MNQPPFDESFLHLASSPIAESVVQWTARSSYGPQDLAWQSRFKELLPNFPVSFPTHSQSIETMIVEDGSTHQTVNRPWLGLRLESEDKKWIVQTDYQGVVLSRLRPYCGWDEFVSQGLKVWDAYRECAEPSEIQRLSVRSINVIEVNSFDAVRDYLQHPPECLDNADLPASGFMYQSLHRIPNHPYQVNVVRTIPPKNHDKIGTPALIVDIDSMTSESHLKLDSSPNHLLALKWLKDKTFFSLITPDALHEFSK
jgi:uncharacterized protein (TIGR04255 family)